MKERTLSVATAKTGKGISLSLVLTRWLVSALALLLLLLLLLFSNTAHAQSFAPGSLPLAAWPTAAFLAALGLYWVIAGKKRAKQ